MTDDSTFRVWIGCLACYNGGDLIGKHYDAIEAGAVTTKDLHAANNIITDDKGYVLGREIYGPHEELWVMDLENAPKGHHHEMSPMEAQRLADVIESVGDNADAFAAWCSHIGTDFNEDSVSDFEDHFHGHRDSFRDYADELAEDDLRAHGIDDEHFAWRHFDWQHHADELQHDYFTEDAPDGGVYIFSN